MPDVLPSHVYYFEIGAGDWRGSFTFHLTSWRRMLRSGIGPKYQLLAMAMEITQLISGASRLESTIVPFPDDGPFGVAQNVVKLSKLGIPLYLLQERYVLGGDGVSVTVEATERFGPLPRILTRSFVYPAEIRDGGTASTYYMPLLGAEWTAKYQVGSDRRTLAGKLVCEWATAYESARHTGASRDAGR